MAYKVIDVSVSIHAPYAGSDSMQSSEQRRPTCFNPRPLCRERHRRESVECKGHRFQSTPPMQGATETGTSGIYHVGVSIHAPYAGSDVIGMHFLCLHISFNPRPLCRERRFCQYHLLVAQTVSIHAPYAGSDCNFSQKFFLIFSRNRQIIILNT